MAHVDGRPVPFQADHRGRRLEHPSARSHRAMPSWLRWCLLSTSLAVLASHLFYVAGLVRAGVGWTDGARAFGVNGAAVSDVIPPGGLQQVVGAASVLAVLFGPLIVAGVAGAAAVSVWGSRLHRQDHLGIATLVTALVLLLLLVVWGDELLFWLLD